MNVKAETYKHIRNVEIYLHKIIEGLLGRCENHDTSKLNTPEEEIFEEYTPKLAGTTYGSEEYKTYLKEMRVALDHHYAVNLHHPEHWKNGIKDMNLIDIVEMLCDWKAATMRHNDGDIYKSIEQNQKRFGYSDELKQIFINTVDLF